MLVSHRHRFIYTKTYKTGGTSVESYFEPFCMAPGEWTLAHERGEYVSEHGIIGYRGAHRPENCRWWNHLPAERIRAQLGEAIWNAYFKFCVVRNPFDKLISAYYFQQSRGLFQPHADEADSAAFERWLRSAKLPSDRNKYVIDGQPCLDFVARHENLHADLARVCARLDLPWEPERLPSFKAGIRPPEAVAARLYNEASREIVREAYAFELREFGYGFPA